MPDETSSVKLNSKNSRQFTSLMQIKYIAGSALIVGALGFLVFSSLQAGTLKSIPVQALRAADAKPQQSFVGQRLRMVGFVGDKPVTKKASQTENGVISTAHFDVVEGATTVAVTYTDALPDTFRAGGPVQVDGIYVAPGVMKADHVLTKCPSKYQAGEGNEKVKNLEKDGAKKTEVALVR